ncbi:TSUP family transporter [Affinibrenneria salicis]|uniref:Probable membrane transporter protein n=1 Tax=Affinibrenneria salicis TaxID=2590031 RepID=A0A5J5FQT7_9GAMM|nr:TSUP family transporter [Affinibrenneria salicis]KAA8995390.1 TSUP family transporter [Affinibrenneria salicis]
MEYSLALILLFFVVAIIAGWVDAIAGGGGLVTIPVMLAAGVPPAAAIATNKLGGVAGTFSASWHFIRTGQIDFRTSAIMIPTTFLGALLGGYLLNRINSEFLTFIIPVLLIGFALYFLFSPGIGELDKKTIIPVSLFAGLPAPLIGFYDGFFGPGTGTFFCLALVLLLGYNLVKSTANAKLLNFSSNLAALIYFISSGSILWQVGIAMLLGQFIGGYLGARMIVKNGKKLIKIIMTIMAFAISAKIMLAR